MAEYNHNIIPFSNIKEKFETEQNKIIEQKICEIMKKPLFNITLPAITLLSEMIEEIKNNGDNDNFCLPNDDVDHRSSTSKDVEKASLILNRCANAIFITMERMQMYMERNDLSAALHEVNALLMERQRWKNEITSSTLNKNSVVLDAMRTWLYMPKQFYEQCERLLQEIMNTDCS